MFPYRLAPGRTRAGGHIDRAPFPQTRTAVLAREPTGAPVPAATHPTAGPVGWPAGRTGAALRQNSGVALTWPLVGRDEELARTDRALAGAATAVVFYGDGGGGKTRLAAEALERLAARGYATARVNATEAARSVPLGALAPLLPPLGPREVNPLAAARAALAGQAAERRLAVLVDDAHLLDDASAALVLQLVTERLAVVLATVHRWRPVPDAITALWKEGHAERIDLAPLGPDDVDRLVRAALAGPVDPLALEQLRRLAEGLPLALVELVEGSIEKGTLRQVDGTWVLDDAPSPSTRLVDLVRARIATLDDHGRRGLELLALGEPLPLDVFEALVGPETAETLEWRSFAAVRDDRGHPEVWLGHALHGAVVRQDLGRLKRRQLLVALADAVERSGSQRPSDLARLAVWRLDAGTPADPEGLLLAARQATIAHDLDAVERLAGMSWDQRHGVEAGYLLGCARLRRGDPAGAAAVLAEALPLADDGGWRATVEGALAEAQFRQGRVEQAIDRCRAAEASAGDDEDRGRLAALRSFYVLCSGDAAEALGIAEPLLDTANPRLFVAGATSATPALDALGRPADAAALARRALDAHLAAWSSEPLLFDPEVTREALLDALVDAGHLDEAEAAALDAYQRVGARRLLHPMGVYATTLGFLYGDRGRVRTAASWFERAAAHLGEADASGREARALAGLARTRALAGDHEAAAAALARAERLAGVGASGMLLEEARAITAAGRGDTGEAVGRLEAAAVDALGRHHVGDAVRCLHTLALLGRADRAWARAEPLRPQVQGTVLVGWLDQLAASVRQDAAALAALADRWEASGHVLFAAEAAATAARLEREHDLKAARALAARAAALVERCEGARPPWLVLEGGIEPLTKREREIAVLAADGLASRAIAERLYLSVRTVDNHLARIYGKLGVSGRAELAEALGRS